MKRIGKNILLPDSLEGEEKEYLTPILPLLLKVREDEVERNDYEKDFLNRSCGNKKDFSKKEAETRRNELNREGKRVREYECDKCKKWHLTHKQKYN